MIFKLAVSFLTSEKLRNALTFTSLFVGILALFLSISLGKGVNTSVKNQIKAFAPDIIMILPMNVQEAGITISPTLLTKTTKFFDSDIEKIKMLARAKLVEGAIGAELDTRYGTETVKTFIVGTTTSFPQLLPSVKIKEGRWFQNKGEAVIGANIPEIFSKIAIGKTIEIAGKKFKIVGILEKQGKGFSNIDDRIFIPIENFQDITGKKEYSLIFVKTSNVEASKEQIDSYLKRKKGKDTYTIVTQDFIIKRIKGITDIVVAFFIFVSIITIVVGLVSLQNSIYMIFMDKRKEMATLLAIGMNKKRLIFLFIIYSMLIGATATVSAFIVNLVLSKVVPLLEIDWGTELLGLILMIISSSVVGYLASKQIDIHNLIEALRSE